MIKLYTKPNCPECIYAKNILRGKGIQFEEINGLEFINFLSENGVQSFPAIFKDNILTTLKEITNDTNSSL